MADDVSDQGLVLSPSFRVLMTADLHLDDQPVNRYRWDVFKWLREASAAHSVDVILILGDLSDRKDRHGSGFVNRLVGELVDLAGDTGARVVLLAGNHDTPLNSVPFWSFLGRVPPLVYVDRPFLIGEGVLALPYSADPIVDWKGFLGRNWVSVVLHQLVRGAVVHGRELDGGVDISSLMATKIWAGDVHEPQKIGRLEYVGAPYPVSFGEDHPYRFVVTDGTLTKVLGEVPLNPPRKVVLNASSVEEVQQAGVRAGDFLRVRLAVDVKDSESWAARQAFVEEWARQKGVNLVSTEFIVCGTEERVREVKEALRPQDILDNYLKDNGISGPLAEEGRAFLAKALLEHRNWEVSNREWGIESIRIRDFSSYADSGWVSFPEGSGLRLVLGENAVDSELGGNGAGKSSLWDAVSYALFGVTSGGDRASSLVRMGAKRADVELRLRVNGVSRLVRRRSNPDTLEIDGQVCSSGDVVGLIGLTEDQFHQSVVFGQGSAFFWDMSLPERDRFLNEVVGLDVWVEASGAASDCGRDLTASLSSVLSSVASVDGGLKETGDEVLAGLREKEARYQEEVDRKMASLKRDLQEKIREIDSIQKALDALVKEEGELSSRGGLPKPKDFSLETQKKIDVLSYEVAKAKEELDFIREHEDCPVCHQDIDAKFREARTKMLWRRIKALSKQVEDFEKERVRLRAEYEREAEAYREAERRSYSLASDIHLNRRLLDKARREADYLRREMESVSFSNPYTALVGNLLRRREVLGREKERLEAERGRIEDALGRAKFWVEEFKKVRLYMLGSVLDALTVETKSVLSLLGMSDYDISYEEMRQSKSGSVKPGIFIQVAKDGMVRSRWSGGEEQRVRLAVAMAMANLIHRMRGVRVDFEVWDEPASYLSGKGVDELFDILAQRAVSYGKRVWVVEHRNHDHPSIVGRWVIRKTLEGSFVDER